MAEKTFNVTGMTCGGCASSVEKVVGDLAGVEKATVVLEEEKLTVACNDSVTDDAIKTAVKDAGFEVA